MSSVAETTIRTQIAEDFGKLFEGKLPPEAIRSAVALISQAPKGALALSSTSSYPANGSIASAVIWMKCQCVITSPGGKTFNGSSWGISFPGGGALFGDVYTSDLDALYANTKSFALAATPVYTSFTFFDGSSNALGSFQAGSVSTVSGTGGGSGSWS